LPIGYCKKMIENKQKYTQSYKLLLLLMLLLISSSCWYSFKGSLPSNLQTVAIPLFNDRSAYANVPELLTDGLINTFLEDNTLKIVNESNADLILNGTIQPIRQQAANVAAGEITTRVKLIVTVKAKCEDIRNSKILFDKNFTQYGFIDSNAGMEARQVAIAEAIELITIDIFNATLGAW